MNQKLILISLQLFEMGNCHSEKNERKQQGEDNKSQRKVATSSIEQKQMVLEKSSQSKMLKENMGDLLQKNVGSIYFKSRSMPGEFGKGCGLLISPNLVLTSAHNIYDTSKAEEFYDISFCPSHEGFSDESYSAEQFFYPPEYKFHPHLNCDFALIKLNRIAKREEYIYLSEDISKFKRNVSASKLAVFGYSSESQKSVSMTDNRSDCSQWGLVKEGKVQEIKHHHGSIAHFVANFGGKSQSPIIIVKKRKIIVIGINQGAAVNDENTSTNVVRLITPELIEKLKVEADKMGAFPFKVFPQESQMASRIYTADEYFQQGQSFRTQGRYPQAINKFQRAIEADPKFKQAYNRIGFLFSELNKNKKAMEYFAKAIEIDPNYKEAYNNYGSAFDALNKKQKAIKCYQKAIQIDPDYAYAYNNMGIALCGLGQKQEALEYFKKAIDKDNSFKDAMCNMGSTLSDLNRKHEAFAYFRKAIEIDPYFEPPYLNGIQMVKDVDSIKQGLAFCSKIINQYPDCSPALQTHQKLSQILKLMK